MRTRRFILAFVFLLAAPSWAGFGPASLPGIGTFSYNGSALNTATPRLVVADVRSQPGGITLP
jgi:hypothetical protein